MTLHPSVNPPCCFPDNLLQCNDASDSGGTWWVARTRSRHEKALARQIYTHRICCYYLPLVKRPQKSTNRVRMSLLPLFPGYIFLRFEGQQRQIVLRTNRIVQLIQVLRPSELIHQLRQIQIVTQHENQLELVDVLSRGKRVRVAFGPMKGLEGTVVKKRGRHQLEIAVNAIGSGIRISIPADMLEAVPY